jgi:hypothetical protein
MATYKSNILITKASGEKVVFSEEKLRNSLKRAGADNKMIFAITNEISDALSEGITTREIYQRAYTLLKKASISLAAKYGLKKAIQELGPSGYPFENYIGEILKAQGFGVKIGRIVQGRCVQHEVDVIAEKDDKHFMIECKFHTDNGRRCSVKNPLYIQSRFLDVEKAWKKQTGHENKFHQGWLVTNTKFSNDAIQYGLCVGLYLMSWDFPEGESLRDRVDLCGLHPVTCLTSLTKKEKQQLLDRKVVLCRDVGVRPELLSQIGIAPGRMKRVIKESKDLCEIKS